MIKKISFFTNSFLLFMLITIPFAILLVIFSGQINPSYPQPEDPDVFLFATNFTPYVRARVELGSTSTNLRYSYILLNDKNSNQEIDLFGINTSPNLEVIIVTSPSGWRGNEEIPIIWTGNLGSHIVPGSSLGEFKIEAESLPGIIKVFASGYVSLEDLVDLTEKGGGYPSASVLENSVKVETIGPMDPPETFLAFEFLDYIIFLKEEAFNLKWIINSGIKTSLDGKLNAAKQALEMGDITRTKNILQAFLNEVEAQNEEHLTSEAYGLLKYNVLFLLDHL